jgi:hypothetical protein
MLRSVDDLERFAIQARDGEVGQLRDLFFDDASWAIHYLVVETGAWLPSQKVLVSPAAVGRMAVGQRILPVARTLEQVRNGPAASTQPPVQRQRRIGFTGFRGYPYKSVGPGSWSDAADRGPAMTGSAVSVALPLGAHRDRHAQDRRAAPRKERRNDLHLRSCNAVRNCAVRANDGEIGSVQGMLVDEEEWVVRYFVVKAGSWWPGHQVLIAPPWIRTIDWSDSSIRVDLTRQQVRESPAYHPEKALNRQSESSLFAHYGRKSYWAEEPAAPPSLAAD